ncbi:hypothetical protein BS50DRAFT_28237 [Corynespora cassiicola Philippines]|uniref:Zn(2)-C6 fungal-type domain-containing protein n=1 Tax=Corynespora cassiicola Philippines TaxID=1448308 RepID=A0A2T2PBD5_CORCC|nr:hypothetical protein BS50DRAFT_28237 [Corynespora cassiicola Philippines]
MAMAMDKLKTRKPHRKSRNGCLPCKARHVKCDEQKPDCVNCDKYGSKCEYPPPKKRRDLSNDAASPHLVASTPSSTDATQTANPVLIATSSPAVPPIPNIQQLRLIHHFTTVTALTLAVEPGAEEVYSINLVKTAFDFPFLLNSLLALAAMHLSRLDQSSRSDYLHQAEQYHDLALSQFQIQISDIDEGNFRAVLFFAFTLFPYFCALPVGSDNGFEHVFDSILSNMLLTRRVRPMVAGIYHDMVNSDLGRAIPKDTRSVRWEDAEVPGNSTLGSLRKFSEVSHHLYPAEIVEAYTAAIGKLEVLFAAISRLPTPPSDALLKLWIHFVSDKFMELLVDRQPGALVIFAHYAVLLSKGQHYWFLEGVSEQMLDVIEALVPTEWTTWLEWPKQQIRG